MIGGRDVEEEGHKQVISKPSSLGVTLDGKISGGIWKTLMDLKVT